MSPKFYDLSHFKENMMIKHWNHWMFSQKKSNWTIHIYIYIQQKYLPTVGYWVLSHRSQHLLHHRFRHPLTSTLQKQTSKKANQKWSSDLPSPAENCPRNSVGRLLFAHLRPSAGRLLDDFRLPMDPMAREMWMQRMPVMLVKKKKKTWSKSLYHHEP